MATKITLLSPTSKRKRESTTFSYHRSFTKFKTALRKGQKLSQVERKSGVCKIGRGMGSRQKSEKSVGYGYIKTMLGP